MVDALAERERSYNELSINSGRMMIQHKRLQEFYAAVQGKIRKDISYQDKWTVKALQKLIAFRTTDIRACAPAGFPAAIARFLLDPFFGFRAVAMCDDLVRCAMYSVMAPACSFRAMENSFLPAACLWS
jgi:hypothetical protein